MGCAWVGQAKVWCGFNMTVLITADWHASDNPRDAYRWNWLQNLPKILRKEKVELLLVLGDLTEVKGPHGASLVNPLVDIFYSVSQVCPVVVLQGNHDGFSADAPYFEFLRRVDKVYWVKVPTDLSELPNVTTKVLKALGKGAVFLPFSPNPVRDWKGLDFRDYDWAFAHQCFAGASAGHGHILGGTPLDIFPPKLKVVAGDIHVPQTIGNLTYVGSPFRIDFGDDFEPRVLLLEAGGKLRSIPCEGPQKRLITLSSPSDLARVDEANTGDVLKVRFDTTMAEHASWGAFAEKVRAWGAKNGYLIEGVQPVITDKSPRMSNVAKDKVVAKTDEQLLEQYAAAQGVDAKTLSAGKRLL